MKLTQVLTLLGLIAAFCCVESATFKEKRRANKQLWKKRINSTNLLRSTTTTNKKLSIVGGMAANPGQFPYVVYVVMIGESDSWYCTGTLVYYNYVLTTAYCMDGAYEVVVLFGEYDLSAGYPETRSKSRVGMFARQWTFHESYDYDYVYDIGIIQLPLYLVANVNITTVPMSLVNVLNTYVGKTATVVGWGDTSNGPTNHLIWTNMNIISTSSCRTEYADITSDVFCAASPTSSVGQGICYGDEGGPLVYLGALLGITMDYYDEGCSGIPVIFTPVATYYSWILSKMADAAAGKFWTVPFYG